MKTLIYLLFLLALGFAQQPEFRVSSFDVPLGDMLEVAASNLSPNSRYALTLSTPEGALLRENPQTDAQGSLTYQRVLDAEGEWSIRLKGDDIDTQLFVTVTPPVKNPLATNNEAVQNPLSQIEATAQEQTLKTTPITEETNNAPTTPTTQALETTNESLPQTAEMTPAESSPEETTNKAVTETEEPATTENAEEIEAATTTEPHTTEAEEPAVAEITPAEENQEETVTATTAAATETEAVTESGSVTETNVETETQAITEAVTETAVIETEPNATQTTEAKTPVTETSEVEPADTEATAVTESVVEEVPTQTTTPSTAQSTPALSGSVSLEDGIVRGQGWRFEFPQDSGQTQAITEFNNAAYIGHGNSVLKVDATGTVLQRWMVSGPVTNIAIDGNSLVITADIGKGLSETFRLEDDQLQGVVRFGHEPTVFSFLKNEANVSDPMARLKQDPTNPWLYLEAAKSATGTDARVSLEQSVEKASTFYDLAGISRELFSLGQTDLADHAMDKALKDFAARGYDPRLLTNMNLHETYNFPLKPFKEAVQAKDLDKAAFWAKWLRYFSSANVPEVQTALSSYATLLRQQGQRSEANLWRNYARAGSQTGIFSLLDSVMSSIGRLGWYGVLSLLIGLLGLALTLLFKYWEPHSLLNRRRRVAQKSTQPWARLWAVRHYSFTEKLFVVLLLASILALSALANWNSKGREAATLEAFKVGTLANGLASNTLNSLPDNPRSDFIRGYAAQVSGDETAAKTFYERAGNFAPAINNLAALSGNENLFKRALELSPGLVEARINQGQKVNPLPFSEYTSGAVLAVPTSTDVQTALANSWQSAVASIFTNPWNGLQKVRPATLAPWLWYVLLTLFLLLSLVSVIWLFIPRPKVSRNAPRNIFYHLLSLLIPGSGLADEIWGIVLLVPWAFIGLDVLSKYLGWGLSLGIGLNWGLIALGIIYLINTIAFFVELMSYQKRMKNLKLTNPDLAREFGMRVRTPKAN